MLSYLPDGIAALGHGSCMAVDRLPADDWTESSVGPVRQQPEGPAISVSLKLSSLDSLLSEECILCNWKSSVASYWK